MKKNKPLNIFAIIFFITLAFTVIFNFVGLLPWGIGSILFKFWPVFIFLFILQLFSRRFPRFTLFATAIGVGVIFSVILFSLAPISEKVNSLLGSYSTLLTPIRQLFGIELGDKLSTQLKIENSNLPDIEKRKFDISILVGSFNLTDNNETDQLVVQANYYEQFGKPEITTEEKDKTLSINLSTQKNLKPIVGGAEDVTYDISIGSTQIPTDLDLNVGAANFFSYFRNLNLQSANVVVGTGKARVYFTKESLPKNHLTLSVGAGSIFLRIPFGTFAQVKYHITVGSLMINDQTFYRDGIFTTPKSRIESEPLEINVNIGAGTLTIDSTGEESIY